MLDSPAMKDVLPLLLEYISEVRDLKSVDRTCSYLHKENENTGWKTFATEKMALPPSYKGDNITWKYFLCSRVRPMYERMSLIYDVDAYRRNAAPRTSVARKVLHKHDWPVDIGIFISCHCYFFSEASLKGFYINYEDEYADSTDSFACWDAHGENDTDYWTYVVLKGSVKVPLAPPKYYFDRARGEPVEIGPGGIVTFSHWNHGGADTTPRHVYPRWDPKEFGYDELPFKAPCDEWVIANLEEPVGASMDRPPAAWRNIWELMEAQEGIMKRLEKRERKRKLQSSS